ncbi:MAG: hypothetical protein WCF95_07410 [bacterium]
MPDKAEAGSAEEQPARNNRADWNDNGVGLISTSFKKYYSGQLCLKKLIINIFL